MDSKSIVFFGADSEDFVIQVIRDSNLRRFDRTADIDSVTDGQTGERTDILA